MINSTVKFSLLGLTALALAALPLSAAEKTEKGEVKKEATPPMSKAERAGVAVPFHGPLTAKTDASITVKERTFEVTSETKITKDGKPATLADGEIGKEVAGQYRNHEGKLIAKSIRFGAKPESKLEVKPEVKPATETKTK